MFRWSEFGRKKVEIRKLDVWNWGYSGNVVIGKVKIYGIIVRESDRDWMKSKVFEREEVKDLRDRDLEGLELGLLKLLKMIMWLVFDRGRMSFE